MSALRKKLLEVTCGQDTDYRKLERRAGLSRNFIFNIIHDRSKNPGIYSVVKLADALECSLDDLMGRKSPPKKKTFIEYNKSLMAEVFHYVTKFVEDSNITQCNAQNILYAINEIYEYSIYNKKPNLDKEFAEWFCNRQLLKEQVS